MALLSVMIGRNSSSIWKDISPSQLRGRIGKNPCIPVSCIIEIWENVGKAAYRADDACSYNICNNLFYNFLDFFNNSRKLGGFLFYLGIFIFYSWRLRILIVFFLDDSSRVQESWFGKLTRSWVNRVSHYILVLFYHKVNVAVQHLPINKYRIKSYTGAVNI